MYEKIFGRGFFNKHLKEEMKVSPEALIEFEKYQNNSKTFLILYIVGIGSVVGAVLSEDNPILRTGLGLAGIGFISVSVSFGRKSSNSFQIAIWIRNGMF